MFNDKISLDLIKIDPLTQATHTILWLHGLGADGNDFVPIIPELHLPTECAIKFIFPNAPIQPVTLNNGYRMRAWYDIYSLTSNHRIDKAGIHQSIDLIHQLIEDEIKQGIATQHMMLVGFSQGAAIALHAGINYPKLLGGVIALSGYLPLAEESFEKTTHINKQIPIFMAHGTLDPVVPYIAGEKAKDLLQQAGYSIAWHTYPMEHSVCAEEIDDISQWIQQRWFN